MFDVKFNIVYLLCLFISTVIPSLVLLYMSRCPLLVRART